MDFHQALAVTLAELTPQPWDYTDGSGSTLTVIPAGLREEPGHAEVMIRITESHTQAAEVGVTTVDMPGLLDALTARSSWRHATSTADELAVTPNDDGSVILAAVEVHYGPNARDGESAAEVRIPAGQRMPLVSALGRALDVARGWEH
ncbi:hypothetical protein [Streptomyces sp. NPDC019937]|uniref:hypothetical protein n=1 Tax=Streptomyces sp. NPDC019937 TaxID=3154787 RepID=UPI0033EC19D1